MAKDPQSTPSATDKESLLLRTFTSVRLYRNFRLVWMGNATEHLGEWMETAALLWLVNQLTHSPFMLVLVGSFRHLPLIVFPFIGGVVADRVNRRNMLIVTLLASAFLSLALAFLVITKTVAIWHIMIIALLGGVVTSFNHPARQTMVPNLVKREHYLNAMTLDNGAVMSSRVIGTPIAGYIIHIAGTTPVFGLRAVGALLAIFWLLWVKLPPTPAEAKRRAPFQSLIDGLSYVKGNKPVLAQVLLYLLPYFVNNSFTNLLPIFATDVLKVGATEYGFMQAAPGLGALISIFALASLRSGFQRKGLLLLIAGVFQGGLVILFAYAPWFALAIPILVLIGMANNMFMTLNNVVIQELVSDQVRGRVLALREVAFGIGPSGSIFAGAVAEISTVPFAISLAGLIALGVAGYLLIFAPRLRRQA